MLDYYVARVSARNTSRLGCDGSGAVVRNPENHSLCTFRTGKQYNCDLSASYNIGARYFIRELLKPLPETERSSLEAKVPAVKRRTSCVYADLRKLYVEVNNLKAA
ncbi:transposase [Clostridium sp. AF50-3]|nr:transposase [Clostridium sp. AF50-3]